MTLARCTNRTAVTIAVGLILLLGCLTAAVLVAPSLDSMIEPPPPDNDSDDTVSEPAYVEPAPEEGDPYFEARGASWISYDNPRDQYRSPYLGDGSGKICVTLLNEDGEFVVGESIPDTTVTIPTGESLEWHEHADPMVVEYPLTDHYDRPLDADQFGTHLDLPQGDGYMDSHCIELHGLPEDGGTVEYGEVEIDGQHADSIEVVGYIQQAHEAWDTDVDPIEDPESYEDAGGGWTYRPGESHGQVVVVLQLDDVQAGSGDDDGDGDGTGDGNGDDGNGDGDGAGDGTGDGNGDDGTGDDGNGDDGNGDDGTNEDGTSDDGTADDRNGDDSPDEDTNHGDISNGDDTSGNETGLAGGSGTGPGDGPADDVDENGDAGDDLTDEMSGFGIILVLVALLSVAIARIR